MKVTTNILSQEQINDITSYINIYRVKHHALPIVYSNLISTVSQTWANNLSINNKFQHSNNKQYGENLSMFMGYKNDIIPLIKKSIDQWYNEIKDFDFNNPESKTNNKAYHFTQLIWNSSIEFGIGYSYNTNTKKAMIVMNFNPAGNILGLFKQNVFPI